jgi:DNA-binding XRE family transcriptional regulator
MKQHQLRKAAREALGLTFADAGRATGLSPDTIRNLEKPGYNTTVKTNDRLFRFYQQQHKKRLDLLNNLKVHLDRVAVNSNGQGLRSAR